MKRHLLILTCSLVMLATAGYSQVNSSDSTTTSDTIQVMDSSQAAPVMSAADSAQMLKNQERAGKISGQLQRNRDKLANLEKQYQEKTVAKQKAIEQAEASAQENRTAAEELSADAANRSKAKKAQKSASRARRDTQSLQRADKNLQKLEKEIAKYKKLVADGEKELAEVQPR